MAVFSCTANRALNNTENPIGFDMRSLPLWLPYENIPVDRTVYSNEIHLTYGDYPDSFTETTYFGLFEFTNYDDDNELIDAFINKIESRYVYWVGIEPYVYESFSKNFSISLSNSHNTYNFGPGYTPSATNFVDWLFSQNDTVTGYLSHDYLLGFGGNDSLFGDLGNDTLNGGIGADTMAGGTGNDTYYISEAQDVVQEASNAGNDWVVSNIGYNLTNNVEGLRLGGTGNVWGIGNDLNNSMIGNSGANSLNGGLGNDTLDGGLGPDTMAGGAGNDTYYISQSQDIVLEAANEGSDWVVSNIGYRLTNSIEGLLLSGTDNVWGIGNDLDNSMLGNSGANSLNGSLGNDTIDGGLGADTLIGGVGNDVLIVDNASDIIEERSAWGSADRVRARTSFALAADDYVEFLEAISILQTSAINLTGNDIANTIFGNAGANRLTGRGGDDFLAGNLGNDILSGGTGKDTFIFDSRADSIANRDRIVDFSPVDDTISLDNAVFTALKGSERSSIGAAQFHIGTGAHDADDRIIYNAATGALSYDPDGNIAGGRAAVQFAVVGTGLAITANDFLII